MVGSRVADRGNPEGSFSAMTNVLAWSVESRVHELVFASAGAVCGRPR